MPEAVFAAAFGSAVAVCTAVADAVSVPGGGGGGGFEVGGGEEAREGCINDEEILVGFQGAGFGDVAFS